MTLQTLPAEDPPFGEQAGQVSGFSLHAGVAARADQRDKLERLCRYISRPAVSEKRVSLTSAGLVRYRLKTPYRSLRSASCCAGIRIIAAAEVPAVIKKILDHLDRQGALPLAYHRPAARAPPMPQLVPTLH